jgi:hypothetical protein
LRVDEIGSLSHPDQRRQDIEQRRKARLVLAESGDFGKSLI